MSSLVLATKLYAPPPRPQIVARPRLIARLNAGLHGKLTLVSAPAGFGKTTLISAWIAQSNRRAAWLSLDEGDNDPARFLSHLIAALQTVAPGIAEGLLNTLQSPQPPPADLIMTMLVNQLTALHSAFILVLDDYHVVSARPLEDALGLLLTHLPPQIHLVIATRQDPALPLARLRARRQLTELRASDLRFTSEEAADFLNQVMGLGLSAADIAALEQRTEGWIAGLQLAAISMQGQDDTARFIESFTGSHHFVLDYLVEEVLHRQPQPIQDFLLRTSVLERLCGPLCDALMGDAVTSGQATLEAIERANLFIVPLDNERRWYRYHHLFAELLRQRLAASGADATSRINELHARASQWYEANGFDLDAFRHAAAAHDIERADDLIDKKAIPLHFRGAVMVILDWLASLPPAVMDARPILWWRYAALLLVTGQTTGVEAKLRAAEAGLPGSAIDNPPGRAAGIIAAARAVLALSQYQVDAMFEQSRRALSNLPPNHPRRATANWVLGMAHFEQRSYAAGRVPLNEAITMSQAHGDVFTYLLATIGIGKILEAETQLYRAAETYQHILNLTAEQPLQIINEAHLGLARIRYEWNELDVAERHGRQSLDLARQYDSVIDRFVIAEVFLARLKLAQGDMSSAAAILAQANQTAREKHFTYRLPEIAAAQIVILLRQGDVATAAHLTRKYDIPQSQARVLLAQGNVSAALKLLDALRHQAEEKDWRSERLQIMILQALALRARGDDDGAIAVLAEALAQGEANGFVRLFVDEGAAMARLLSEAQAQDVLPDYIARLLAAFEAEDKPQVTTPFPVEPLSQREREVLYLVAQGLSNHEIGERLFLALDTVKGHNRRIYGKLHVQRRTEAVARARELGLI